MSDDDRPVKQVIVIRRDLGMRRGKEIAQAALKGDAVAQQIFRTFGENLAECVAPWLERFGADAFVVGGNLALCWDLYVPALEAGLSKRLSRGVAVKPCELG